jgi:hypothetical protein
MTHPNAIQIDFVVEVEIDGLSFEATITSKNPKVAGIAPVNPVVYANRFCDYTQILRVISRPAGGEVAA